jgi:hypothetical protein
MLKIERYKIEMYFTQVFIEKNYTMPIEADSVLLHRAFWTVVPGEEVDCSGFSDITSLYISAYCPVDENGKVLKVDPFIVPSFAGGFENVTELIIKNWGNNHCIICGLTDVPESVRSVTLEDTYISDLGSLLSKVKNLVFLIVGYNRVPMSMSGPLPCSLRDFILYETTVLDSLIFPPGIKRITCSESTIPRIYGLNSVVNRGLDLAFAWCVTPYDNKVLNSFKQTTNIEKILHITRVNALQVYCELGSIPVRIRVSEENIDNPIVVAMKLASNYPRRMAEFVADMSVLKDEDYVEEDDAENDAADNDEDY